MQPQRPNYALIVLIIFLLIGAVAGIAILHAGKPVPAVEVSEQMPEAQPADASWETYTDEAAGISFRYPAELSTTYIRATEWPPTVRVSEDAYQCDAQSLPGTEIRETEINGSTYCVTEKTEGAAGSIFTDYTYATERNGKLITLAFTLRSTQCGNYDETQMQACTIERESFNPDTLVGQIAETLQIR